MMRKAFTLMEVNLAIMIMAGGILAVVSLFSFGYRENRQSREDVAATAYADAVISPLIMAITSTNVKWSTFKDLGNYPSQNGWGDYLDNNGIVKSDANSKAQGVFSTVIGKLSGSRVSSSWPSTAAGGMKAGLVVMHDKNSGLVRISFRAARHERELMSAPMYYTEARFQGTVDE